MKGNGQHKGDNHEKQTSDIAVERKKKLFDAESDNPSIDSERAMLSNTIAKEETEESQKANKKDQVPATVSPEQIFSKNGSLCKDSAITDARDR